MIPYGRQDISSEDVESIISVLKSDWLTQGPKVPEFEESICKYTTSKFAVAVNSATSALHLSCLALDVGHGDVVWTSPISFVASANCALYCGAQVDFIDIDETYNISIEALKQALFKAERNNKLPKVLIVVHMAGHSCDMQEIASLSARYGFTVIEDASHAIGGEYYDSKIGSCLYSDICIFSFHPVKIITTGEGGMALTNSEVIANKMRSLRSHGIVRSSPDLINESEIWNYHQSSLGFNYRITDLQAALGISQLKRIDDFVSKRNLIAKQYNHALVESPIATPYVNSYALSSYHLYIIRIDPALCGYSQRDLYNYLRSNGIMVNLHYIPIYRHPYYQSLGFKEGHCPSAELYFHQAISLPIFPLLTNTEQDQIISCLLNYK